MKYLLPIVVLALLSLSACKGANTSVTPTVTPTPTASASAPPTATPTPSPSPTPVPTPSPVSTLNVVANGLNGTYTGTVDMGNDGQGVDSQGMNGKGNQFGQAVITVSQTGNSFTGQYTFNVTGFNGGFAFGFIAGLSPNSGIPDLHWSGVITGTEKNNVLTNVTFKGGPCGDIVASQMNWIPDALNNTAQIQGGLAYPTICNPPKILVGTLLPVHFTVSIN